ncbi:MAG: VTT domain-containing protein [Patescibacteria group bacterium]|nr:VTT domain-containing protein [Patescibacteria group bacterium]
MKIDKKLQIWTLLSFALSVIIVVFVVKHLGGTENILRSVGIGGPLVSIALYGILSVTPITTDSLTIINGAMFGPFWGSLISWMGNNFASFIEYFIGHSISKASNFKKNKHKIPFGLGKLPADSVWFLILGRFIPGYGGKLISLIAGVCSVPLWRYTWTTAFTNLLGSILLALGGHGLVNFF